MRGENKGEAPWLERQTKRLYVAASVTALVAITVLITFDTILRYFFSAPTAWIQDAVGVGLFLMFCACLPYSWFGKIHVSMDIFEHRLPTNWRRMIGVLGVVAALVFGGILAYRGIVATITDFRFGTTMPSGAIPTGPVHLMAAACLIVFCASIIYSVIARRNAKTN